MATEIVSTLCLLWPALLLPARATPDGIRLRWPRRRRHLTWRQVEAVEADPVDNRAVLVLVDGDRVASGFAATRAAELAALGGRPLRAIPVATRPTPPPRIDEEKALRQRAVALSVERDRLVAELARLRRHPG